MKKEINFKGIWTPEYLAQRLLLPIVSIQTAETMLSAWAQDIIDVNTSEKIVDEGLIHKLGHKSYYSDKKE